MYRLNFSDTSHQYFLDEVFMQFEAFMACQKLELLLVLLITPTERQLEEKGLQELNFEKEIVIEEIYLDAVVTKARRA